MLPITIINKIGKTSRMWFVESQSKLLQLMMDIETKRAQLDLFGMWCTP